MNIIRLELCSKDLQAQRDYYSRILDLPVDLSAGKLEVRVGRTLLVFRQAAADFDGAYHFAFNIPANQFHRAKAWVSRRVALLADTDGRDEFESESWNSSSLYFKDAAGNVLEFIARRALQNAAPGDFAGSQILNISEIGLASEDVLAFAGQLCSALHVSTFKQEPHEAFTPIGDDDGLLILPIKDRMWIPNSGVRAKLLPVRVLVDVEGKTSTINGVPYQIA